MKKDIVLNYLDTQVPQKYFGFIYKTIFPNGKIYIGQTTKRVEKKYFGSGGRVLECAYKKYGFHNLKREILEFCDSQRQLNERESYFILNFNSNKKGIGYNILEGESDFNKNNPMKIPGLAKRIGEENRNSGKLKGENHPLFGKKLSKEHKLIISMSNKRRKGVVTKNMIDNLNRIRPFIKRQKGRIWICNGVTRKLQNPNDPIPEGWFKGRWKDGCCPLKGFTKTEEHRKKLSLANLGKKLPLEQRNKISKSLKKRYEKE